jgi:branched-chain amino acid transport system ATP-binding protein
LISALLGAPRSDGDERDRRDRALSTLDRLGCVEIADRLPTTLPFAMQKRVALARALVSEPELLLLDEPAGGLDATELSELSELIRELGRSIAVMLVEHHMDLVMSVCDRVVVLDFGRVIAEGNPTDVRADKDVLDAYLGRDVEPGSPVPGSAVPGSAVPGSAAGGTTDPGSTDPGGTNAVR